MGAEATSTRLLARRHAARGEPVSGEEETIRLADLTIEYRNDQAISRVFALSSLVLAMAFANLAVRYLPIAAIAVWLSVTAAASLLPVAIEFTLAAAPETGHRPVDADRRTPGGVACSSLGHHARPVL